jgi:PAS domain S-box-containing protein
VNSRHRVTERTLQLKATNDTLVRERSSDNGRNKSHAKASSVSERAETIFGWTRTEAIGRELADTIIPSSYRDAHRRGVAHVLASGEGPVLNRLVEMSAVRPDANDATCPESGRERWSEGQRDDLRHRVSPSGHARSS